MWRQLARLYIALDTLAAISVVMSDKMAIARGEKTVLLEFWLWRGRALNDKEVQLVSKWYWDEEVLCARLRSYGTGKTSKEEESGKL